MNGILRIAYKLLVNDKGKFAALLVGITFAVFLMIMMTSMFAGILHRSSATVLNVGAKVWVMDPAVNTPANSIPLPDYILDILDAVRSMDGVKYPVPLYSGGALVRLRSGEPRPSVFRIRQRSSWRSAEAGGIAKNEPPVQRFPRDRR